MPPGGSVALVPEVVVYPQQQSSLSSNYPLIVPETFQPMWRPELDNTEYHQDKSSVGSSVLKTILKSPATFYAHHVLGLAERDETEALRIGRALHMALLEPALFQKTYVRIPEFTGKTRDGRDSAQSAEARARRQEWRDSLPKDAIQLSESEFGTLMGMIHSVMKHQDALNILRYGVPERAGYYRDPQTGILCRIKPDLFHSGAMGLIDIKTTDDVSYDRFGRKIFQYGYDFQMAMYCEGIYQITGKRVEFPLLLAVEKKPPYEVAVYQADNALLAHGLERDRYALSRLKECLQTKTWPSYQENVQVISLPKWAIPE